MVVGVVVMTILQVTECGHYWRMVLYLVVGVVVMTILQVTERWYWRMVLYQTVAVPQLA